MKRLVIVATFLSLIACSQPKRVLTSANAYDFYSSRYERACGVNSRPPRPFDCRGVYDELLRYREDLQLAGDAVKRGGKFPLQVEALKAHEKALAKVVKK